MTDSSTELEVVKSSDTKKTFPASVVVRLEDLFASADINQLFLQECPSIVLLDNVIVQERLKNLYYEAASQIRKKGKNPLRIGFPLLNLTKAEATIHIPIFERQIKLNGVYADTLSVSIDSYSDIQINNQAKHWLTKAHLTALSAFLSKRIKVGSMIDLCEQVSEVLDVPFLSEDYVSEDQGQLKPNLFIQEFLEIDTKGLSNQLPKLNLPRQPFQAKQPISLLPLDDQQSLAFQYQPAAKIAIEGRRGTGKTQLLLNYLLAGLENKGGTLILSKHLEPLKLIQQQLLKMDLGRASILLRPQIEDSQMLLDYVRSASALKVIKTKNQGGFEKAENRLKWAKEKLNQQLQAVNRPLINGYNWTNIVGRYLKNQSVEGKELLNSHLNPLFFKFTTEEFQYLEDIVGKASTFNQRDKIILNASLGLHPSVFLEKNQRESKIWLTKKLTHFIQKSEKLKTAYAVEQITYSNLLFKHYDQHRTKIVTHISSIKDLYVEAQISYGRLLNLSNQKLLFRGMFSRKYHSIKAVKKKILTQYEAFASFFHQIDLFEFKFPQVNDLAPFERIEKVIHQFETAFDLWRKDLSGIVQAEMAHLGVKTAVPELAFSNKLANLEKELNHLLEDLNVSTLLAEKKKNKFLVIPQQQKLLENIIHHLSEVQVGIKNFEDLYNWNRFWLLLNENGKKLINALRLVDPHNWLAAFESWYWNHALIHFDHHALPSGQTDLTEFDEFLSAFQPLQRGMINYNSKDLRANAVQALKKTNKPTYINLYQDNSKHRPFELNQKLKKHFNAIVDNVPVMLSTPEAIAKFIDSQQFQGFNQILIEDAHNLSVEQLDCILTWSERVILLYEKEVTRPSWLSWLANKVEFSFECSRFYQIAEGNLFAIKDLPKNEHGTQMIPCQVEFHQIDGRYDEKGQTNDEEAQFVLRLLNELPTQNRVLPRVGIVTCTRNQRDLIQHYINQIQFRNLPGRERINQLIRSGLEVINMDELSSGERYEVVILSATYGIINLQREIPHDIFTLENSAYLNSWYEFMAIPRKHLFMVNSIPIDLLVERFTTDKPSIWAAVVLNYKAIAEKNNLQQEEIFTSWKKQFVQPVNQKGEDTQLFLKEVVKDLVDHLPKDYQLLKEHYFEGYKFPYLLTHQNKPQLNFYFIVDGFLSDNQTTNYQWEIEYRKRLKKQGWEALPLYSVNWWKDKSLEIERLQKRIHEYEMNIN